MHSSYVQSDPYGYPLRMDAMLPQYHLHDGMKLDKQAGHGLNVPGYTFTDWHWKESLVAGACKNKCDIDMTCKGFAENRWQFLHTLIKCTTFHFAGWMSETNLVSMATPSPNWDLYVKYTNPKKKTWLHAPLSAAGAPTTQGRRLDGVY